MFYYNLVKPMILFIFYIILTSVLNDKASK